MIITTRSTQFCCLLHSRSRFDFAFRRALKLLSIVALVIVGFAPQAANADDTTERLRTSVARMNHWLGSGSKAQPWRKILDLNVLDSQAAKGEQADPQTLRDLLGSFDNKHESLQHPVFREVRNSIQAQIEQIDRTRTQELANRPRPGEVRTSGIEESLPPRLR